MGTREVDLGQMGESPLPMTEGEWQLYCEEREAADLDSKIDLPVLDESKVLVGCDWFGGEPPRYEALTAEHAACLQRLASEDRAEGLGPHNVVDDITAGLDGQQYREALAIACVWGMS